MDFKHLRTGILGMARSGIAAALKVLDHGGSPFISEYEPLDKAKARICKDYSLAVWERILPYSEFGGHSERILQSNYIIVSPGIPLTIPIIQKAYQSNIRVISEIEFGYLIKAQDSKIIAVTGSNGKSTTVSLIKHLLSTAGYNTILAGNIGKPFTSYPCEKPGIDYIVLELSSFQLEAVVSFKPDTAVLLNITPDHLDRYPSMKEYTEAKLKIFSNQNSNDLAVLNADDEVVCNSQEGIAATKLFFSLRQQQLSSPCCYYDGENVVYQANANNSFKISKNDLPLAGLHNIYNTMAAILAVSNIDIEEDYLAEGLKSFRPLPHRLEPVATVNGITFINDSKATNTDSVKYALGAYDVPIHIILGGYHKGEDYATLIPHLRQKAKAIYVIGAATDYILNSFRKQADEHFPPVYQLSSLEEAVTSAYEKASEGDLVLLSPACASYDMFRNFEHRGEAFKESVNRIVSKNKPD